MHADASTCITDLGSAATRDTGISAGNVVAVGPDGKIDNALIPQFAISQVHVVETKAQLLELTSVNVGDVGYLQSPATGESVTWILAALPASSEENWLPMQQSGVLSVNGEVGPVVVLTTSNIAEGANLYWTDARFTAAFGSAMAVASVSELSDGAHVMMDNRAYVIDGGYIDAPTEEGFTDG